MASNSPILVLASSSIYRSRLLGRLGLSFEVADPLYQEEHHLPLTPQELVRELADRKARSLAQHFPRSLILGSDQVAEINGEILLKPKTPDGALAQLSRLIGKTHRLLTGVAVFDPISGQSLRELDIHTMTMRNLTREQIHTYVQNENPIDCAGGYKVEGQGIALFESMQGEDYTGIIGLPLTKVVRLLQKFFTDPSSTHYWQRPEGLLGAQGSKI